LFTASTSRGLFSTVLTSMVCVAPCDWLFCAGLVPFATTKRSTSPQTWRYWADVEILGGNWTTLFALVGAPDACFNLERNQMMWWLLFSCAWFYDGSMIRCCFCLLSLILVSFVLWQNPAAVFRAYPRAATARCSLPFVVLFYYIYLEKSRKLRWNTTLKVSRKINCKGVEITSASAQFDALLLERSLFAVSDLVFHRSVL